MPALQLQLACVVVLVGCGGQPSARTERASSPAPRARDEAPEEVADDDPPEDSTEEAAAPAPSESPELLTMADARWTTDPTFIFESFPHRVGFTFRPCRAQRVDGEGHVHAEADYRYDEAGRLTRARVQPRGESRAARFCFGDPSEPRVGYRYHDDGRLSRANEQGNLDGSYFYDTRVRSRPDDPNRYAIVVRREPPDAPGYGFLDMLRVEDGRAVERLTTWLPGDEERMAFQYDEAGRLVGRRSRVRSSSPDPGPEERTGSDERLGYDTQGRFESWTRTIHYEGDPSSTAAFRLERTPDGHLARCIWAGEAGYTVRYARDATGRLTRRTSLRGDTVLAEWRYEYSCEDGAPE